MLELPRDMHSWIAPSLMAHAEKQELPLRYLIKLLNVDDEMVDELVAFYNPETPIYWNPLLEDIQKMVIEYDATTNNGEEFHVDDYSTIPWCDEDTYLKWYS
jgi:hypothetical protein